MLNVKVAMIVIAGVALSLGIVIGYLLASSCPILPTEYERVRKAVEKQVLPEDILAILDRLTLVNRETGEKLERFVVLGAAEGVYESGGAVVETFVLAFEDRYGGAEADIGFLDVIVEFKRVRGGEPVTLRMVQLGFDTIEVYLDEALIGSIRPGLEIQVKS